MNIATKAILTAAAAAAVLSAKQTGFKEAVLHLPTGDKQIAGYHYDLTGSTVYGAATPVTFTDKFAAAWIGDTTAAISKTDKWYTDDPAENWTVYTFEIYKGVDGDDAWLSFEIGF